MFDHPAFKALEAGLATALRSVQRGVWIKKTSEVAERLQWARDNEKLIEKVPLILLVVLEWESADEPWQFLAACRGITR